MARVVLLALLGVLLLSLSPAHSSPARTKPYREAHKRQKEFSLWRPGTKYEFQDIFQGNERACVIVEGDHKPPMNLTIQVFDLANNKVAEDKRGGDIIGVTWYPPKTDTYRIVITADGDIENLLDIVVK
jgi:hypothetical protein